jgi:hypothetical protein
VTWTNVGPHLGPCGARAKGRQSLGRVDQVSTWRTWSKEEEALSPRRESKVEPGSIPSLPSDHDADSAGTTRRM